MSTIYILASFIFISILIATATGWVARRTGRSFKWWFLFSILMPVFPLCIIICLPEEKHKENSRKVEKRIINEQLFNQLHNEEEAILN